MILGAATSFRSNFVNYYFETEELIRVIHFSCSFFCFYFCNFRMKMRLQRD